MLWVPVISKEAEVLLHFTNVFVFRLGQLLTQAVTFSLHTNSLISVSLSSRFTAVHFNSENATQNQNTMHEYVDLFSAHDISNNALFPSYLLLLSDDTAAVMRSHDRSPRLPRIKLHQLLDTRTL